MAIYDYDSGIPCERCGNTWEALTRDQNWNEYAFCNNPQCPDNWSTAVKRYMQLADYEQRYAGGLF